MQALMITILIVFSLAFLWFVVDLFLFHRRMKQYMAITTKANKEFMDKLESLNQSASYYKSAVGILEKDQGIKEAQDNDDQVEMNERTDILLKN
jgi:hypothetical protein